MVLDLRLELRANARLRCGYCHDELEASAEAWRCARCETPQHSSCQAELGRCQVIGCDSSPRQAPRARGDSWLKRGFRGALCALSGALALMAFAAAAYVGVMSLVLATHLVTQRPLDLSAWLFAGAFSLPALAFAALVTWLGLALWEAAREAWTSSQSAGSAHA